MWDDIHLLDPLATLSDIKNRLSDQFSQKLCSSLTETTRKLRTYKLFKSNLQIERYLILPYHLRIRLTHLQISCHQLSIETGHYNRPQKIPLESRLCPFCKDRQLVEDEKHFLLDCTLYKDLNEFNFLCFV